MAWSPNPIAGRRPVSSRQVQVILASIFASLGGWCLLAPGDVEQLVLRPELVTGSLPTKVLIGCFGAQAVLCGVVIAASRFTPATFLIFGLAGSIPFFCFNYYFYFVVQLFNDWMLVDFIGNIAILICGIAGAVLRHRELRQVQAAG